MIKMEKICVIGLGYVGLPLAVEFAKYYNVTGYDISEERVAVLNKGLDPNAEVESSQLQQSSAKWTSGPESISDADCYIITVPTPVDADNKPNLSYLDSASRLVGGVLKKGAVVVYESTVYPGCTEEFCKPILEQVSGLKHGEDFYLGYSPERVNPSDKVNTVSKIVKVVSGCCDSSANAIDEMYARVIDAGTFLASSIKVAEAAKVTENIQRDVNIALMNELSRVFNKLDIDTFEVIDAASSKWNFIPFRPGLVGGHCIGVDPYYLISKAEEEGIDTPLMSSARLTNEAVVDRVVEKIKELSGSEKPKILQLGLTFKEDCPDFRNSKSMLLAEKLIKVAQLDVMDPYADKQVASPFSVVENFSNAPYDFVIISVRHKHFLDLDSSFIRELVTENGRVFDLLNVFPEVKDYSL